MNIYEKKNVYDKYEIYPFHMPAHKRNIEFMDKLIPYNLDLTEIKGFDDLHNPTGILQELNERAAKIFKADETYCLVNGSTVGNLAAILGVTNIGDKIIVARNSHKSIYNAIELNNLEPIYVYPEFNDEFGINGEIKLNDIAIELEKYGKEIKAVIITSPTYEGVISDIENISNLVHSYGVPLIVDEAHGAHLGFDNYFNKNSNELGADIVIQSIHKTLPAPTQTALIHINGDLVNKKNIKKYLAMLQSSSPSYILMSGISNCLEIIENPKFDNEMIKYIAKLKEVRYKLSKLNNLKLVETSNYDRSKIVISTKGCNLSSTSLFNVLRHMYDLELEMDGISYVIAMSSVADTYKGMDQLAYALADIDTYLVKKVINKQDVGLNKSTIEFEQKNFHELMEMRKGTESYINDNLVSYLYKQKQINQLYSNSIDVLNEEEILKISKNYIYMYPPGIPIITPGEPITKTLDMVLKKLSEKGYNIIKN